MPVDFAAKIQSWLAEDDCCQKQSDAILAVVAKCEKMRAESGDRGVGHFIADEIEGVIARKLEI
jgi:hypothetical protein